MVVAVGRGAEAGQRPELEETIVDDIEGLGFVAKAVFAAGLVGYFSFRSAAFSGIWVAPRLVGTGIIDIGCLRVAGGRKAAVLAAGVAIAGTAFFAQIASRTGTVGRRRVTTLGGMAAFHA